MIPKRHKWSRVALKCILSVICLSLFSAQLSYKFYEFSSLPSCHKSDRYQVRSYKRVVTTHSQADKVFLSLDKRYDITHLFALTSPSFRMNHPLVQDKREFSVLYSRIVSPVHRCTSLRGPPLGIII
jgi:hypothetical protein